MKQQPAGAIVAPTKICVDVRHDSAYLSPQTGAGTSGTLAFCFFGRFLRFHSPNGGWSGALCEREALPSQGGYPCTPYTYIYNLGTLAGWVPEVGRYVSVWMCNTRAGCSEQDTGTPDRNPLDPSSVPFTGGRAGNHQDSSSARPNLRRTTPNQPHGRICSLDHIPMVPTKNLQVPVLPFLMFDLVLALADVESTAGWLVFWATRALLVVVKRDCDRRHEASCHCWPLSRDR